MLIASALFTLAHTTGGIEWHSLPAIAVLGLSMAVAYERTGRIAVPIAILERQRCRLALTPELLAFSRP